jgi:hypothetical protein
MKLEYGLLSYWHELQFTSFPPLSAFRLTVQDNWGCSGSLTEGKELRGRKKEARRKEKKKPEGRRKNGGKKVTPLQEGNLTERSEQYERKKEVRGKDEKSTRKEEGCRAEKKCTIREDEDVHRSNKVRRVSHHTAAVLLALLGLQVLFLFPHNTRRMLQ